MATVSDITTIPAEMDDILVSDQHEKHAVSEKHVVSEKPAVSEKQLGSDTENIESGSCVTIEDYGTWPQVLSHPQLYMAIDCAQANTPRRSTRPSSGRWTATSFR